MDAGVGATVVVIVHGEEGRSRSREVVVGRVLAPSPDLVVVDALARLALAVQRLGWSIRLRNASPPVRELLELAGLSDLLADD